MLIKTSDYYSWHEAPIDLEIDEEMAEFIANILRGEIKEAIRNDEFEKGLNLLHSLNVLERVQAEIAEDKAKKAKEAEEEAKKALEEYQSETEGTDA